MAQDKPWDRYAAPVAPGGMPSGGVMVSPDNPYQLPRDAASLESTQTATARTRQQIQQDAANADFIRRKLAADARKSEIDASIAARQADPAAAKTPSDLDAVRQEAISKIALGRSLIDRSANGWFTTGGGASLVRNIPNTGAYDVAADTQTLQNAGALTRIMEMARENGGKNPLTPLSNSDFQALSSSLANLDTAQSDGQYQRNIGAVLDLYRRAYEGAGGVDLAADLSKRRNDWVPGGPLPQPAPQEAQFDEDGRLIVDVVGGGGSGGQAPPTSGGPEASSGFNASPFMQGMSGVNEGLAGTLGLPVDLMTMAMNAVPTAINAATNSNLGKIERPFAGGEWFREVMGATGSIVPEAADGSGAFIRRMGQSVGSAGVPIAGTAGSLAKAAGGLATAAAGGAGAAAARELAPGNPYAEFAGEVVGSGLSGGAMLANARRTATRAAEAAVPTVEQLRNRAGNLYDAAEARGVVAGPNVTGNMAGRARQIARDEVALTPIGGVVPGYESVNSSLKLLDDFNGASMSAKEIDRVRRVMAGNVQKATDSNERRISKMMLGAFDDETLPLAPEFGEARNVASRYLQADDINLARDQAGIRASGFAQSGMENALRTDFRGLSREILKGTKGFNPDVETAINNVVIGGPVTNTLRTVGKLAPRSNGGMMVGGFVPASLGASMGEPGMGFMASAGTMALGEAARRAATSRTVRAASLAELTARNGGAINVPSVLTPEMQRAIAAQTAGQASAYR